MNTVAIDFGTTRTKAAWFDPVSGRPALIPIGDIVPTILPSVFYIPPGDDPPLVGDAALDYLDEDPPGIVRSLKREIHKDQKIRRNKRAFAPVELAALLFERVRRFCETAVFYGEVRACVLTVPVAFDPLQRERIEDSARRGGFTEVELIDESVAAARHWLASAKADAPLYIVVCDIGGGTTDLALLRRTTDGFAAVPEVPPSGFQKGGNDIDEHIFDELLADEDDGSSLRRIEGFRVGVQQAKERFSRDGRSSLPLKFGTKIVDLTRTQVEVCSARFVEDVVAELKRFRQRMDDAVIDAVPLLLVGGGAHILGLEERFSECWNAPVLQWHDSEYATALGAAQPAKLAPPYADPPAKKGNRPSKPYDPNAVLW